MSRAVLSVGSNIGDRLGHLRAAVIGLENSVRAVSAVYETAPWGPVPQDDFLNAIVVVEDDDAGPGDWLRRGQALERAAGRTHELRYGPRTLDVDVISVDDVRSADPDLTLPHPRAAVRAFVLIPWLAIVPDAVLPGVGPVATLVAGLDSVEAAGVHLRAELTLVTPAGEPAAEPAEPTARPTSEATAAGPAQRTAQPAVEATAAGPAEPVQRTAQPEAEATAAEPSGAAP